MAYVLAVLAALANALTSILQRMGVESAPADKTLKLSLITYALRRKVWIAGFVLMIGAFLLQFLALHFGRLTTVQPILTLELPFLVVVLGVWFRQQLSWKEWVGSIAAAGGLAAFLVLAAPSGGGETPDLDSWGIVSFAVVAGGSFAVLLARFGSAAWRAAWFGVAGAIAFAFTAAIIKEVNDELTARGWAHLFVTWPPYAMAGMGLVGMFLAQNAFQAGPVTASQSALVIVDPLASIAIGIGLFGDTVRAGGGFLLGEVLAMVLLSLGVLSLARSPLVVHVKSEDDPDPHLLGSQARGLFSRGRHSDDADGGGLGAGSGTAWESG
ncbi:MAG: DMT family transporter [Acidimicrobiales bacterium]|jgi:drug/metabolite transporter (DMT)-like permease